MFLFMKSISDLFYKTKLLIAIKIEKGKIMIDYKEMVSNIPNCIKETYEMNLKFEKEILELESRLMELRDKAFEEADLDGKLRILKDEIDDINNKRKIEIAQRKQSAILKNEILKSCGVILFA